MGFQHPNLYFHRKVIKKEILDTTTQIESSMQVNVLKSSV
jgi:hypothetical protein